MPSASNSVSVSALPEEAKTSAVRTQVLPAVALLAICGLGVWTRLRDLGAESFWYDEAITFLRARLAIPDLVADSIAKNHVPTYFVFMHYWMPLGDDEWWLRLPSAIFGMLKVPVLGAIGWTLGGVRVGLAAALLLVLSQPQLQYDQEARMYALQNLAVSLALLGQLWLLSHPAAAVNCFARRTLDQPQPSQAVPDRTSLRVARVAWASWIFGSAGALWLHNTSALFLTASSCATVGLLIVDRTVRVRMFWYWVAANLIVLLVWCPWWPTLVSQLGEHGFGQKRFTDAPSARQVWDAARMLMLGGSEILNGLMVVLTLLGVFELRRRPAILLGLLLLSLLAAGQMLVLSQWKPLFVPRLFLWGTLAAVVLAAHGVLFARHGRWSAALVFVLVGSVTVLGLSDLNRNYYDKPRKPDWRGAAQLLANRADEPGVAVYGVSRRERKPLTYYSERTCDPIAVPPFVDATPANQPPIREWPKDARRMLLVHEAKLARRGLLPEIVKTAESDARRLSRTRLHGVTVLEYDLRHRPRS